MRNLLALHLFAVCLSLFFTNSASAEQTYFVNQQGQGLIASATLRSITTGEIWKAVDAQRGLDSKCAESRDKLIKPKKESTAFERLDAAEKFEQCVVFLKSSLASTAAAAPESTAMNATFVTQNLATMLDKEVTSLTEPPKGDASFMGMTFGVGIGFSYSRKARVTDAEVAADGTLRATTTLKEQPRVILEAHYFGSGWCGYKAETNAATSGCGPFFGLAASNDTINAFAVGLMYGWRAASPDPKNGAGFSVGIGAVLDSAIKDLAPGFEQGKPLPANETQPKFVTSSKWSPLLFFTKTF
jgi:hypothetical protein